MAVTVASSCRRRLVVNLNVGQLIPIYRGEPAPRRPDRDRDRRKTLLELHKWEFEIASGRCLVDSRLRVRRYVVHVDEAHVVVTLDHPSPELA